jgi:hypothetical protein
MVRVVHLGSDNAEKAELIRHALGEGWLVSSISPGNAEYLAPTGYRYAAAAKAERACKLSALPFVLGHDSGFEFDDLDGQPGPLTARWLRENPEALAKISPGSVVRVVHCMAVATASWTATFIGSDVRNYTAQQSLPPSGALPLSMLADGPRRALRSVTREVLCLLVDQKLVADVD